MVSTKLCLFGELVLTSTSGGANLWMGNNPATTGFYQNPPDYPGMNEVQLDRRLGNDAVAYIKQAPAAFATRTVVKALRLYERETIGVAWNRPGIEGTFGSLGVSAIKVVSQAFWMGALLLFVIGCYFSSRQGFASFACHPAIATLAYFTVIYAIIVVQDRYHVPTDPIVATFAAYAISQIVPVSSSRFWPFGPMLPRRARALARGLILFSGGHSRGDAGRGFSCRREVFGWHDVCLRKRLRVSGNFDSNNHKHHPQCVVTPHPGGFKAVMDDDKESKREHHPSPPALRVCNPPDGMEGCKDKDHQQSKANVPNSRMVS